MGIIAKQTIKGSVFSYLGVVLGGINVAILYPRILSEDQIGLINILIALSAIFAQFSSLGINGVTNYFFHHFITGKSFLWSGFLFDKKGINARLQILGKFKPELFKVCRSESGE